METRKGRFFSLRGVQQDDGSAGNNSVGGGERTQEIQDASEATAAEPSATLLARIRAMLGGAPLETSPTSALRCWRSSVSEAPGNVPRDKSAEELRTERAAVRRLRHENNDLRRQLAESQGAVRALKEELAGGGGRRKSEFPKPYRNLADEDHEKVLAFIESHGLDPAEDYDRALMGLTSAGQIKAQR